LFIHVAVPVPNLDLLTYAVPEGIAAPKIGARVVVPLGTRVVTGIVIETDVTESRTASAAPRRPRDHPDARRANSES
jgi:primosomal protein N'